MPKSPESSPRFDFDDEKPTQSSPETPTENQTAEAPVSKPTREIPGFDPFGVKSGREDKRYT